jgi:hypothetical protein
MHKYLALVIILINAQFALSELSGKSRKEQVENLLNKIDIDYEYVPPDRLSAFNKSDYPILVDIIMNQQLSRDFRRRALSAYLNIVSNDSSIGRLTFYVVESLPTWRLETRMI